MLLNDLLQNVCFIALSFVYRLKQKTTHVVDLNQINVCHGRILPLLFFLARLSSQHTDCHSCCRIQELVASVSETTLWSQGA